MTEVLLLGRRAVREVVRYPEATIPTLFIPLFFLAVNIGQVSKTLGARIQSGVAGALLIVLLSSLFGVAYAGFGILVALRTRNVQATQSSFLLFFPLLFLTPNFVPFDRLSSAMETLARINPVSYVIVGLRSLVIDGWDAGKIGVCIVVIAALGAVLTALSLRAIATYDR